MKQNRLVSRLPFFVFNCQGSQHHPASASSSGYLCRLPAPVMHSGLRQGSTGAPSRSRPETPDSIFFKQHNAYILSMDYYAAF